jgi:hypothetical protein
MKIKGLYNRPGNAAQEITEERSGHHLAGGVRVAEVAGRLPKYEIYRIIYISC